MLNSFQLYSTTNMILFTLPKLVGIVAALPVLAQAATANDTNIRPIVLADTNRDGRVDALDKDNKYNWTSEHGAIFLPNIGDEHHRCHIQDELGKPLSNQELAACNDATGDVLINATLAAPLLTMPVSGLSESAHGRIFTEPAVTLDTVRLFWKQNPSSEWALVQPELRFNKTTLASGVSLALDARSLVTDLTIWDGRVNVVFEVTDGNVTRSDFVALRQAPVLVHHHLQRPDTVVTLQTKEGVSKWQSAFVKTLQKIVHGISTNLPLMVLNDSNEVWAQDFMEPAFASMPGPNGPISIRVLLRSAQSTRENGRRVFEQLRGAGVGGWQPGRGSGFGWEEINSGGNIETIPPYTSRSGVPYLNGKVLLGKHFGKYPALSMTTFLQAQQEQTPLFLETGWLTAGHIDEIAQFLPSNNTLGFKLAVPDTRSAMGVLKRVRDSGHGSTLFLSYHGDMTPDAGTYFLDTGLRNKTVDSLLSSENFTKANEYAQRFIDFNVELLLEELPIVKEDVVRVPSLYWDATYPWPFPEDGVPNRLHRTIEGERLLQSFFPHALNGLVLGRSYIAPKSFGPIVNGTDVLEEAIEKVYRENGMDVSFVDDYMSHHVRGGEVHCGTNVLRETGVQWWK